MPRLSLCSRVARIAARAARILRHAAGNRGRAWRYRAEDEWRGCKAKVALAHKHLARKSTAPRIRSRALSRAALIGRKMASTWRRARLIAFSAAATSYTLPPSACYCTTICTLPTYWRRKEAAPHRREEEGDRGGGRRRHLTCRANVRFRATPSQTARKTRGIRAKIAPAAYRFACVSQANNIMKCKITTWLWDRCLVIGMKDGMATAKSGMAPRLAAPWQRACRARHSPAARAHPSCTRCLCAHLTGASVPHFACYCAPHCDPLLPL